jgi:hypothetical protein
MDFLFLRLSLLHRTCTWVLHTTDSLQLLQSHRWHIYLITSLYWIVVPLPAPRSQTSSVLCTCSTAILFTCDRQTDEFCVKSWYGRRHFRVFKRSLLKHYGAFPYDSGTQVRTANKAAGIVHCAVVKVRGLRSLRYEIVTRRCQIVKMHLHTSQGI